MQKTPMISVIMPVWNTKPYLQESIDSVLRQTYTDWELIIVDDGSTDGSSEICDRYEERDPRIHVFRQENRGLSGARNTGLLKAAGQFLQFLDSDDWLFPETLEKAIGKAAETDADMVIFDAQYESPAASRYDGPRIGEGTYPPEFILTQLACTVIPPYAWNKFCKRKLYDSVFFPEGENWEDAATTFYPISRAGIIAVIPEPLYHYRQRDDAITKQAVKDKSIYKWRFIQYRKRYEFLKKEYPAIAEAAKFTVLNNGIKYYTYTLTGNQHSDERKKIHTYLSDKGFYSNKYTFLYKMRFFLFRHFPGLTAWLTRTSLEILKRVK